MRLGSLAEEEKKQGPAKTFSGLAKVNKKGPKIEYKWRCQQCMTLNKVEEHKACKKCGLGRDMTPEEEKKAT